MDPAPTPRPPRLVQLLGLVAFLHLYAGGLATVAVVAGLGPPLAMLAQMMGGWTEPDTPALPFPWGVCAVACLLPLPLAWRRRWRYAALATVPMVVVPLGHLVRLYWEAGPP